MRTEQQNTPSTQIYLQVGQEHKPIVQSGADGWFRVVVGPFANKEAALAYRENLSAQGRTSVLRLQ